MSGTSGQRQDIASPVAGARWSGTLYNASLSDHVRRVPVVLFADALDEIGVRFQAPGQLDGPRLGISLWIVNGDLDVHVADPWTGETFGDVPRFGPWMPLHVEPCPAVLSDGIYDQRVLVPMADRIAHPGRLWILRERPAIREDLTVDSAGFVQEQHQVFGLHQLQAIGDVVLFRYAGRQTGHAGVILSVGGNALIQYALSPRRKRHLARLQVGGQVQQIFDGIFRHPEAGQIGLAVRRPHRRRFQIDLAVGGARHSL